jgi:hypothetical protein
MYDFYQDNKTYCISVIILLFVCIAGVWLVHDAGRNERLQNDTDNALVNVNQGITNAEGRINAAAESAAKAEAAIGSAAAGIANSERAAGEISAGITECQDLVDRCVQRAGKIENIIADIETGDRKRTAGASAASLAK